MSLKATKVVRIGSLQYETNSSLQASVPSILHRYLFLFVIKILSCYLIWNSFWRFLWAPAGKFLLWSAHLFICCQMADSLHTDILYFHSQSKIYFIWHRVNSSSRTHSPFSLPSFLHFGVLLSSSWYLYFKLYWRPQKISKSHFF